MMTDPFPERISVVRGDITEQHVDAVVNAANPALTGGGGVDGAIHRAAGPELDVECRMLGGCATGDAVMTRGYRLPARYVIHTVGPVWKGGDQGEDALLASCYRKALEHADSHGLLTIAFPAISTGTYGFPLDRATRIAVTTVVTYLRETQSRLHITFVCHSDEACRIYDSVLHDPATQSAGKGTEPAVKRIATATDTPGDIREQVAGQLGVIEAVYGIRITNRDPIIGAIVRRVKSREAASRVTAALNSWIALQNVAGRIDIPEDVIHQIVERTGRA